MLKRSTSDAERRAGFEFENMQEPAYVCMPLLPWPLLRDDTTTRQGPFRKPLNPVVCTFRSRGGCIHLSGASQQVPTHLIFCTAVQQYYKYINTSFNTDDYYCRTTYQVLYNTQVSLLLLVATLRVRIRVEGRVGPSEAVRGRRL